MLELDEAPIGRTTKIPALHQPCAACETDVYGKPTVIVSMHGHDAQPEELSRRLKGKFIHDTIACRVGIAALFQEAMTTFYGSSLNIGRAGVSIAHIDEPWHVGKRTDFMDVYRSGAHLEVQYDSKASQGNRDRWRYL